MSGQARALEIALSKLLTDTYGHPLHRRLPDGIRLELHPYTYRLLIQDPEVLRNQFMSGGLASPRSGEEELAERFEVPVKVTRELPPSAWRLVIVTEDVLADGTIAPEGVPA